MKCRVVACVLILMGNASRVLPGELRAGAARVEVTPAKTRSEEHTSELQSRLHLVCRLLLEKKKKTSHQKNKPLNTSNGHPPKGILYIQHNGWKTTTPEESEHTMLHQDNHHTPLHETHICKP